MRRMHFVNVKYVQQIILVELIREQNVLSKSGRIHVLHDFSNIKSTLGTVICAVFVWTKSGGVAAFWLRAWTPTAQKRKYN